MTLRGSTADPDVVTMNKHIGLDIQPSTGPRIEDGVIPETHDGIIIALLQQEQTNLITGYDFDDALENIHSLGFSAGSCLIANTYLHLTLVRHGSVFQVIDPWLTSWYSSFAMETFVRDLALGYSVGEAYERGIRHVGVEYLVNRWWWDIFENVVYFGDPDLRQYVPIHSWPEPEPLQYGAVIDGHASFGALEHPHAIKSMVGYELTLYGTIFIIGAVVVTVWYKRRGRHKRQK